MIFPAVRDCSDFDKHRISRVAYQTAYDSYLKEDYEVAIQTLESEFSNIQIIQLESSVPLGRAMEIYCWCLEMTLKYEKLKHIRELYSHVEFEGKSQLPIIKKI